MLSFILYDFMVASRDARTPEGFSFSQVHVVALDFAGNGPRHVLRGIIYIIAGKLSLGFIVF